MMSALPPPRIPDSNEIHTKSGGERFVIGFLFGAMAGFFSDLLYGSGFGEALVFGVVCGAIIGSIGALFGKRVFDFLIELISRFT